MEDSKTPKTRARKAKSEAAVSALSISIFDLSGKQVKSVDIPAEIFDVKVNHTLLTQYIRVYNANQRQGNASTKGRSEVNGSTKKIYRQKGTGRARHGSKKPQNFIGGGVAGGPKPKDYSLRMNKKQKKQALFTALTSKARKNSISGFATDITEMEPKTAKMSTLLKNIGIHNNKVLVVASEMKKNGLVLASRNIPNVDLIQARNINPYEVMTHDRIIFVEDALTILKDHFLKA